MRKRFKKRLLGIILTILMVVSVIPVQQVQPVKAAAGDTLPSGTIIYLRPNAATTWIKDNAVMAFKTSADNKQSEIVVMTKMDDGLTWYGTTTADATNIDFLRLNPNDTNQVWNEADTWPGLERGKNLYTFASTAGVTPTGMWTTYSSTGSETTSYFYVNASLVDYFNNGRVEQPENKFYNEGNLTGPTNAPYSQLNQWISNLQGYALNGVDSKDNVNAPVPLYFGDLLHAKQAGGNLTWYWQGANVAFGPDEKTANKYVAQGIVGKNLDKNGNLITSYNNNGEQVKVPFFNEKAYDGQSKYMRFYNNLQFPFTKKTNDKGVSTYSFDSEQNTVHYDYENNKIVRDDTIKIHDVDGDTGYFPFNSVDPSAKDNLNYGFGTQFTIPFTVTETGKNVDGTSMTFKFTGDDDVWVYIDGALVLDMGGAHCKAEGEINFATQMATITTGTSDAKLGNQPTAGGRVAAKDNGKRTVDFKNITVKKSDGNTISLADYMKESGKVHELKMYYMERGMWDSNMSISYSFVPLPSGLTLSKTLDTKDVNAGLKNAVQGLDNFDFNIQTRNLKDREANYSDVDNLGYTLYDYNDNTYPGQVAKNSTATFSSSYYASEFIDTTDENNSSAFYAGTGFKITESIPKGTKLQYDETKTKWGVYDSVTSRAAKYQGEGAVATFDMGDVNSSEMDVVNRYVNFVNTPKVGSLSVEKKYEGDALKDKTFGFTVKVDLTGGEYYDPYELEYTIGSQTEKTDENGHFTLKAGEKVTFAGIPAGASYEVVEDAPGADDTWVQDTTSNVTGKIEADVTSAAVVTNKTKTTVKDYVIYAEAGKTVTYAPDGVTITELTAQTTGDTVINTNVKGGKGEFTPESPNEKYVVNYTGTTTNNGNFTGTITVYTYKATDKVYVFDYGLESNIADATTGDGLFQDGTFYNDKAKDTVDDTTAKLDQITSEASDIDDRQTEITGNQNAINRDGSAEGEVTFKPIAFMDKVEKYTYTANITKVDTEFNSANPETGTTVHGTIKTMPANVVYYEDNFNEKANSSNSAVKIIYSENNTSKDGTDVKLEQSNDQSEQYGHDNAYANGDKYSSGSSTKMEKSATATFTFKGTGFDIISRTNTETGTIGVKVYKGEKASGEPIRNIPLITYYDDGDLYQVPVIHETDFDYGTYTVVVEVKSYNPDGIVFYLDGVRIYEPLDDQEYTDEEGTTYDSDNYLESEVDAHIYEIRPMIIGNTVDGKTANHAMLMQYTPGGNVVLSAGGNTVVETLNGIVPEGATETTDDFERYWKWGPNNELYLEPGNAVGFLIPADIYDSTKPYATFQIGAKATSNKAVTLKTILPDGTEAKDSTITVNSATDMYYKINVTDEMKTKDGKYYQVVIANTDGGMVSLTNIKSTCDPIDFGVPAADTTAMRMMAASMISAFSTKDEVVSEAAFATVVRSGRDATLAVTSTVGVEKLKITDSNGQVMDNSTLNISYTDKVLNGNKLRTWRVKFKPNLKRGKYKYTVEGITAENKATVRIGTPTLTVR